MTDNPVTGALRAAGRDKAKRGRGFGAFVRDIIIIFVVAILVSFLIKTFLIRSFYIPSGSMENTLMINDRIIVNELVPNVVPVKRGDVVVFTDPGGWLAGDPIVSQSGPKNPVLAAVDNVLTFVGLSTADSDDHLVKRVIGVPGDHLVCCNVLGQITVNGTPLQEPYISSHIEPGDDDSHPFNVIVPPGDLWVLGDNRANSQDSSLNQNLPGKGFVPIKDVVGRAVVISWPLNRWTWLSNYPQVFGSVSADSSPADSSPADSSAADSSPADSSAADSSPADSGPADSSAASSSAVSSSAAAGASPK